MIISVINHTNGEIADEQVQHALRAINRQIEGDFAPYWNFGAELRLEGRTRPQKNNQIDLRGDAVLYLWNNVNVKSAMGYHDANFGGLPFGFVYTEISQALGEDWTVTLSHEALELIADPEVNLLVMGPHPAHRGVNVFHWYEMCDAVQDERYQIDGVEVQNFVLPLYFTGGEERAGRNDFLGRAHKGKTLRSFGVNPGGYVGFHNPKTGTDETYPSDDPVATKRLTIKSRAQMTRRSLRYQRFAIGGARPSGHSTRH